MSSEQTHILLSVDLINNLYAIVKIAAERGTFRLEEYASVANVIEVLKQEIANPKEYLDPESFDPIED